MKRNLFIDSYFTAYELHLNSNVFKFHLNKSIFNYMHTAIHARDKLYLTLCNIYLSPHSLTLHHYHSLASLQLLAVPRTIHWSHSLLPLYMAYSIIIDQITYCDAKKTFPWYWCTEMA